MGTSVDAVRVAQMSRFQERVNFFVVNAATDIMAELAATPAHSDRVTFANLVLLSNYSLTQYVAAVLNNETILAAINTVDDDNGVDDSDLEFTVNSFYNAFSGVATV